MIRQPGFHRGGNADGLVDSAEIVVGEVQAECRPQVLPLLAECVRQTKPTEDGIPEARYKGFLNLMDFEVPCYVLSNGQRVIGRTSFTEMLTGIKGGGDLEKYLGVSSLKPFIDMDIVLEGMVSNWKGSVTQRPKYWGKLVWIRSSASTDEQCGASRVKARPAGGSVAVRRVIREAFSRAFCR